MYKLLIVIDEFLKLRTTLVKSNYSTCSFHFFFGFMSEVYFKFTTVNHFIIQNKILLKRCLMSVCPFWFLAWKQCSLCALVRWQFAVVNWQWSLRYICARCTTWSSTPFSQTSKGEFPNTFDVCYIWYHFILLPVWWNLASLQCRI